MKRLAFVLACSLAACGGVNDVDPRVISGGGVGDGSIEGELNVHVIDSADDSPVSGASVLIGEPGDTPLEGTTDSTGLITFTDDSLDGATTITATAAGYVAATWFGANGANVTIAIDPDSVSDVPQAQLQGTITGWDDLPAPPEGTFLLGIVQYSQTRNLGDPVNEIAQGVNLFNLPANACFKGANASACDWQLNSRTGEIALFATIVELELNEPDDDSDDVITTVGFAHKLTHNVEDGIDQSGIELEMVDDGNIDSLGITLDSPPGALDQTGVLVGIDLGDDRGIAYVVSSLEADDLLVPDLAGDLAGMTYQVVALAGEGDDRDDATMSAILVRDIGAPGEVEAGPWLDLPTGLDESAGEFSFEPVDGSSLHSITLRDAVSNDKLWAIAVLDGRTTFSLPAIEDDPLPDAELDMSVISFDGDINVRDFSVDEVFPLLERLSVFRDGVR